MFNSHSPLGARVAVSVALAGTGLGAVALPASASAKKAKPLTKAQVIALIQHYSKPGPTGPPGPSGPSGRPGSYTIGSGLAQKGDAIYAAIGNGLTFDSSGKLAVVPDAGLGIDGSGGLQVNVGTDLSIGTGNKLQVTAQSCPNDELSYGTNSNGTIECNYAPEVQANSGPFNGAGGTTTLGTASAPSATSLAQVTLNGRGTGTSNFLLLATVNTDNFNASAEVISCSLVDTTTSTILETQNASLVNDSSSSIPLMWEATGLKSGDTVQLQCSGTSATDLKSEGTLVEFPNG